MMGIRRSQCSTDRSNPWGIWLVMLYAWIGATDLWEQYPMSVACGFDVPVVFGGCRGLLHNVLSLWSFFLAFGD